MRSGNVWLWEPVLYLERIFVGRLREPVLFLLFGVRYYCVCGPGPPGSGSRFAWGDMFIVFAG